MPKISWLDVTNLSFNVLLLLEKVQLSWFPGWVPETELAVALKANPVVEWYLRHKCPQLNEWLDNTVFTKADKNNLSKNEIRQAEITVMESLNDLLTYAVDPATYDAQPFMNWDSDELISVTDFNGKVVIDVGAGTGRLTLIVASTAAHVFAIEPVANLRCYLKTKATKMGLRNVFPVDGLITDIPFPDGFADITMGGHIFGDHPEKECRELERVTKPGGMIILCPGNQDLDNDKHRFLVSRGFDWSRFEEPGDRIKRKYWKKTSITDRPG